jgi:SAM-dependent methyltransferase
MTVQPSNRPDRPPSHRPCPVCGGLARRVLHRQRFLDGPLGDGYDVVVCRECGAGFADGIPSQQELDTYYAERSKYTYDQAGGAESPYDFRRFELIADQVVPFLPSRQARILDIGCATGGLLAVLQKRGFTHGLGADPSPACAAAARRLHGVEVRESTLAQLAGWTDQFDLILLVGVLEHLREVHPALEIVRRLLAPGGLLYCAQPDVAAFSECVNAPYQQFSVEHVNFFSESSLNRLLARSGLGPRRTWHWLVEWREGVTDSVVSGIYGADPTPVGPARSPNAIDGETGPALEQYLDRCRSGEAALLSAVNRLAQSQEPVLIWGAGTLTRRLLASTPLAEANVVAFVDSDPGVHWRRLAGREVLSPSQIVGRREAIVICSKAFEHEIRRMVREELRLPNPLILLASGGERI